METMIYNEVLRGLKQASLSNSSALDECLYTLSCKNNQAWRMGKSNYLSKVEPVCLIKDKLVSMKIHNK